MTTSALIVILSLSKDDRVCSILLSWFVRLTNDAKLIMAEITPIVLYLDRVGAKKNVPRGTFFSINYNSVSIFDIRFSKVA